MDKRVAIIVPVGFDGGGITTLGIQYSKIGLPVYFKDKIQPLQFKPTESSSLTHSYSSLNELFEIASCFDRLLFLPFTLKDEELDVAMECAFQVREKFGKDLELCYIHCSRKVDHVHRLLNCCDRHGFKFDHIFSISPLIRTITTVSTSYLNINAYTFPKLSNVIYERDRQHIVFSASRVEALKGTIAWFTSITPEFFDSAGDFCYLHEGAKFSFHKSDTGVSTTPHLLTLFDTTVKPKRLKPQYVFKRYGECPEINKFNIYPSYNLDDIYTRWITNYAGICCILGTKSICKCVSSLLETKYVVSDRLENRRIQANIPIWGDALEYADMEKIALGIPVLFSRKYAEIIGFTDEHLIYDSFVLIPKVVSELHDHYDRCVKEQRMWLVNRQKHVNANIVQKFRQEFL